MVTCLLNTATWLNETLHVIRITWLGFLKTEAAKHMPSDGNLAKRKLMFTFNTMNYHMMNNSGRSHLSVWIGNTPDIEKTLGASTLPNPKSGIILILNNILCISFAMDEPTPNTPSPGGGVTEGSPSRTRQQGTGTSPSLFVPDVPNTGSYWVLILLGQSKGKGCSQCSAETYFQP